MDGILFLIPNLLFHQVLYIKMSDLQKYIQCNEQKSVMQFSPWHRICFDCQPPRNENFPKRKNHHYLYCQEVQLIQSFIAVNNPPFQTYNQCQVSWNQHFLFTHIYYLIGENPLTAINAKTKISAW